MIPLRKLIEVPRPQLLPDEFGFLVALDKDLRSRMHSGPDGIPYEVSRQLTTDLSNIPPMGLPPGIGGDEYFTRLADIMERYKIEPFAGRAVAFVGFYDPLNKSTLRRVDARLLPKQCYDIAPQTGSYLTPENALQLTDNKKVDYVITGNVVNAPNHDLLRAGMAHRNNNPEDVMHAAALMLKEGGYAIHLCGFGGDPNAMAPLSNEAFITQLGQEKQHVYGERTDFEAVVLQQTSELAANPALTVAEPRFYSTGTVDPVLDPAKGMASRKL